MATHPNYPKLSIKNFNVQVTVEVLERKMAVINLNEIKYLINDKPADIDRRASEKSFNAVKAFSGL